MAEENCDFVMGFICTKQVSQNPKFIHMTPGEFQQVLNLIEWRAKY